MKFCTHCGKEVEDNAVICPGCGCPFNSVSNPTLQNQMNSVNSEDKASAGLIIASILIPIIGIILWITKNKETPQAAKTYGIVGIAAWVVSFIIILCVMGNWIYWNF